jgi:hypothetical protein
MTGLEFDSIDILGPVKGRVGMGYFDCFCVPSVNSVPPTPENPNPASSRHCASIRHMDLPSAHGTDYVGQSTEANYTVLKGEGWVGLNMEETVGRPARVVFGELRSLTNSVRPDRAILSAVVVPPRWRDWISLLYSATIRQRNGRKHRQFTRVPTSRRFFQSYEDEDAKRC